MQDMIFFVGRSHVELINLAENFWKEGREQDGREERLGRVGRFG